jgi:hypothetical protein
MTDTMIPSVEVTAPRVVPYPFGLFSVVTPETSVDPHWQAGVWWRSEACASVGVTYLPCQVEDVVPPKSVNVQCGIITAPSFTVYARSDESMGGSALSEKFAAARALLMAGEQYAVESALWALLDDAIGAGVSSATGGSIQEAIAMAEGLINVNYGGTGVMHMSRYTATMAGIDVLRVDGARLRTLLGTPVAAGAGYLPAPDSPFSEDDAEIIVTGALVLMHGEVFDLGTVYDTEINDISAVVERTYVVGWDCTAMRTAVLTARA